MTEDRIDRSLRAAKVILEHDARLKTLEKYGIYKTLDELKDALVGTDLPYSLITSSGLVEYSYILGDFTGQADDINTIALNKSPIQTGALVQRSSKLINFDGRSIDDKLREYVSITDKRFAGGARELIVDNAPSLQAAIDVQALKGGGAVFIPEGVFPVRSTVNLKSNVTLHGNGPSSILDFSNGANLFKAVGTQSSPLSNISMRNFSIRGKAVFSNGVPSVLNGSAIDFQFTNNCSFSYLTINGFASNGIAIANGNNNLVSHCTVDACEQSISLYANVLDVEGNRIIGNLVTNNGHFNAIHLEGSAGDNLGDGRLYNTVIQGNSVIDSWGHGFNIELAPNTIVSGNTAIRCGVGNIGTNEGFFFFGSGLCVITGNIAIDCYGRPFFISAGCSECSLTGNSSYGCGGRVLISDGNGVQVTLNVTEGNNSFNEGDVEVGPANASIRNKTRGFTFANKPASDSHTLDWYEENSFAPVVIGGTTAGVATYTARGGKFTRIGNVVNFQITVGWSSHTGSGPLIISGLPYASTGGVNSALTIANNGLNTPTDSVLQAVVFAASDRILFYSYTPTSGDQTTLPLDTMVPEITITGMYMV